MINYKSKKDLINIDKKFKSKSISFRKNWEELIIRLNTLKNDLQLANQKIINNNWKDIELIKKLRNLEKKKCTFLKMLLNESLKSDDLLLEIKWSAHLWHSRWKLALIFKYKKETIHISHIKTIQITYIAKNKEQAKLIASYIWNQQDKTFMYEKIKKYMY